MDVEVKDWDRLGSRLELRYVVQLTRTPTDPCGDCPSRLDPWACSRWFKATARRTEGRWVMEPLRGELFSRVLLCMGLDEARSEHVVRRRLEAFVNMSPELSAAAESGPDATRADA